MLYLQHAANALHWSLSNLRTIGIASGCFVLTVPVALLLEPTVEPIAPAVGMDDRAGAANISPDGGAEGPDFVFRPLFLAGRKPLAPQDKEVAEAEREAALDELSEPETLEGVVLLGVVASEGHQAIIVRSEGERLSLTAGDEILGWTLSEVGARSAQFTSGGGRTARVDLAMASNLALPLAQQTAPVPEEPVPLVRPEGSVTFDSMYDRRRGGSGARGTPRGKAKGGE